VWAFAKVTYPSPYDKSQQAQKALSSRTNPNHRKLPVRSGRKQNKKVLDMVAKETNQTRSRKSSSTGFIETVKHEPFTTAEPLTTPPRLPKAINGNLTYCFRKEQVRIKNNQNRSEYGANRQPPPRQWWCQLNQNWNRRERTPPFQIWTRVVRRVEATPRTTTEEGYMVKRRVVWMRWVEQR
jgi:hypothetical protein